MIAMTMEFNDTVLCWRESKFISIMSPTSLAQERGVIRPCGYDCPDIHTENAAAFQRRLCREVIGDGDAVSYANLGDLMRRNSISDSAKVVKDHFENSLNDQDHC